MATDYPRIARLQGGLNDNKDDALQTLLTDAAPTDVSGLQFITDKNATLIQSQIYKILDNSKSKEFINIDVSGNGKRDISDSVILSGSDSFAVSYEFNFEVKPGDDDPSHNIVGKLSDPRLVLKLDGNPSSNTLNNAKILNKNTFSLTINPNAGLDVSGDLSAANLSASLSLPSTMDNMQNESWTVSNGKAQVEVKNAGVRADEDNENNVYYVSNGNFYLLSNASAQDYDGYFDPANAQLLKQNFGSHSDLNVFVEVDSAEPSLETQSVLSLVESSMNDVTTYAGADANVHKELLFTVSRQDNTYDASNGLVLGQVVVSRLQETLPAIAQGNSSSDLVVEFDSSDRFSLTVNDASASGLCSANVSYSALSQQNKTTEDVSFNVSKERNPWNIVSDQFYTEDSSYNASVGTLNIVSLGEDRVFKLTKLDQVSLQTDVSHIKQVNFSLNDPSNNNKIDVCGNISIDGTVESGLDLSASSLRVLFEPNLDADAKWDLSGSSSSVTQASVDLTGVTHWDIAVNNDFFDSVNRSYSYVLNSADSADPGARIIFQNEVGTRTTTSNELQAITVTSNRRSQNQITNSNSPISIFINLNDPNVVDASSTKVEDKNGTKVIKTTVTHVVKIKKHFIAGLGGLAGLSRDFYQYTFVAEYDGNGDLVTSGNKFDQNGVAQVLFDVNAYTHSAKLMYGNNQLAGPVSVDFRVMSKGFLLDLEDGSANLSINSIKVSIPDGGRNARVNAKEYELVLSRNANSVRYAVESKSFSNALQLPDPSGINDASFNCETTGPNNLRLKDGSNTVANLTMNSQLSDAPAIIYVVARQNALWNVSNQISSTQTSGSLVFNLASGVVLDVSNASPLFSNSSDQLVRRDFKLGKLANVTLKNDQFKVTRWAGDASGSLAPIPSNQVLLDQSGVTQVSATAYRGFDHGAKLIVKRNKLKVTVDESGNSLFTDANIDPLVDGESRDVAVTGTNFSSLKVKLLQNTDNSQIKLTVPRPRVYLAVCDLSDNKLESETSSADYSDLLFSNMFSKQSLRPFTDMFFLNNMVQSHDGGMIKIEIRSGAVRAHNGDPSLNPINVPLDGTEVGLLGSAGQARLKVKVDPSANLRLDANTVTLTVPDNKVDLTYRNENGIEVSANDLNLNDCKDSLLNAFDASNNYSFVLSGLSDLLADASSVALLYNNTTSYSLTVKNNLFSIHKRFYDPSNSNWMVLDASGDLVLDTSGINPAQTIVDKKELTDSSTFEASGSLYVYRMTEGNNTAKLCFSNPLQRPLVLSGANELYEAGKRQVRFESWHLEQANDASGVEHMHLVHAHSQLLNLNNQGRVENLSNAFIEMNGKKWLALQSIEAEKYEIIIDPSANSNAKMEDISLEKICSFDQNGCALPAWPGNVTASDYLALDLRSDHDGSYNDHNHSSDGRVRMMTIGMANEETFHSQLLQSDRKTGPQGNVAYRVVLQDLLHIRDHNQMLALRVDPAGGVHTNALYAPSLVNVYGSKLAPMPPATGLNVRL